MSQFTHMYNNTRWRKRRAEQLMREPLCRYCKDAGTTNPATVADHLEPHRGNVEKFEGPLQSLCKTCHDSAKALEESGKGRPGCDVNGYPLYFYNKSQ